MNREEAILRELNLYPLWELREGNGRITGHHAVAPLREQQNEAAPSPAPLQQAERVERQMETATARSREQIIGELGWPELKAMVRDCTACKLRAGCTQTVFGVGDEKADWLLVGEAPGAEEDRLGEPFVGQAGRLLDNMLDAVGLSRGKNVYIANVLKCRPPGNRNPEPDEVAKCAPHLLRQIALIQPKLILAMGRFAVQSLLGTDASIASLRGRTHRYAGVPLVVTYHPAYLLRNLPDKSKAWADLVFAKRTIEG